MSSAPILARDRRPSLDVSVLVTLVVAGVVLLLAIRGGAFGLQPRTAFGLVVWWSFALALLAGIRPEGALRRLPLAVLATLGGLAAWTLASLAWSPSAQLSFAEFDRVSSYLGVAAFAALLARRRHIGRWCDGLALSLVGVAGLALVSRLVPEADGLDSLARYAPGWETRLSYPVGYWNGLGILLGLSLPLLLRAAVEAQRFAAALAVGALPAVAAVIYLTSSRGGVAIAAVSALAFLLLCERRWEAATALVVAGLAAGLVVSSISSKHELVNGPLLGEAAREQSRAASFVVLASVAGSALLWALIRSEVVQRRPSRRVRRGLAFAACLLCLAAFVSLDPVTRFDEFRATPDFGQESTLQEHIASAGSSGRWQYWGAAVDQFEAAQPLLGDGAGTFGRWWARNGSLPVPIQNAHSLYAQTLGELGLVGFALVLLVFVLGGLMAIRAVLAGAEERTALAALAAVFAGFAAANAIDWVWELTIVPVVAFIALGVLLAADSGERPVGSRQFGRLLRVAGAATGIVLAVAQAIPLLSEAALERSRSASASGSSEAALDAALTARDLQPWAPAPYLQLALVAEQEGDFVSAQAWIEDALERDRSDWRLWLLASRIQSEVGRIDAARASISRARELNPRSPLLSGS